MKYDKESIEKRKKTTRTFKRVMLVIVIILIYNVILLFFSSVNKLKNVSLFGYKSFIITTNSMEPSIKNGDAILTKKTKAEYLKEGDVITYNRDNKSITHRIIKVEKENNSYSFVTKGDNNNVEDKQKIKYDEIEGKKLITFPKFGYIIQAAENQLVILIITLVVLIFLLCRIQSEEKKYKRRVKKKNEAEEKNSL